MQFDKEAILEVCNKISKNTLMETLQIKYIDAGENFLSATMPVNRNVFQPMGLLHGGATVALAESVGSAASRFFIDASLYDVKGIEITANHLRSVSSGNVTAVAKLIHKGRTTHLLEIKVFDDDKNLISFCKMTNIILER
jgi:1,4-dihydroxy-2-naphthoyl-CoA hydrolase